MKQKYIHIGYPKAGSTTLQNDFFSQHSQLYHLGFGHKNINGKVQPYVGDDINIALEMDLRCKKDLAFDYEKTKSIFHQYFAKTEKMDEIKAVGISFEGLSYTNVNDIDITQKAERLKYIFGDNTKIIIVTREQRSAIKSFYSACVQSGYFHSYKKFIEYLLLYQFRSFISDFKYYDIYKLYCRLFGKNNVLVLPFEILTTQGDQFEKSLSEFLGIEFHQLGFTKKNPGHVKSIQYNRLLNYLFRHNLGNAHMTDVFSFRYQPYFKSKSLEHFVVSNNERKKKNVILARKLAKFPFLPMQDFDVINHYIDDFNKLFSAQNTLLSSDVGLDLSSLGYLTEHP